METLAPASEASGYSCLISVSYTHLVAEKRAGAQGEGADQLALTGHPAFKVGFEGKVLEAGKAVQTVVQVQIPEP